MEKKLGLLPLIALVVGTMVGGGIFHLPRDIAAAGNSGAVLVGWIITAIGMISLALVYQNLSNTKPDLDGGVYSYARAGFGEYIGFSSAWGYWVSGVLGNIALFVLLFSAIGYFFPVFGEGNNIFSLLGASLLLWSVHLLILMGIREASIVNTIATIGKIIPILLFVVVLMFVFKKEHFTYHFWGGVTYDATVFFSQVKNMMLVTLWVFIGVEGAVVLSGRAEKKSDVGKATVLGLIATLILYVVISFLSLGAIHSDYLITFPTPSMAYVLEEFIGPIGSTIINLGLIISLLGAIIGWTLLVVEIPYIASKDKVFPSIFAKENKEKTPVNSLWVTSMITQLFLVVSLFSESTYQLMYSLATTSILVPYFLSALFQLKLLQEKRYRKGISGIFVVLVSATIATIYTLWLVVAAGLQYLLVVMILYALGIVVFIMTRLENKKSIFRPFELILAIVVVLLAIVALFFLITGRIHI